MDQIEKEQIIEIHDELCDLLNGLPPIIVLGAIAMFIGQMTMTRRYHIFYSGDDDIIRVDVEADDEAHAGRLFNDFALHFLGHTPQIIRVERAWLHLLCKEKD